jgi:hypothetical protein
VRWKRRPIIVFIRLRSWLVFEDEAGFSITPPQAKTCPSAAALRECGFAAAPADGCPSRR